MAKKAAAAHHGGAWKVAYADFVTAMMAFFLLLWLLNATTEEQRKGISDYFAPASVARSTSGGGGVLGGKTMTPEGAQTSQGSIMVISLPQTPTNVDDIDPREGEFPGDGGQMDAADTQTLNEKEFDQEKDADPLSQEAQDKLLAKREEERFDQAAEELRQAILSMPELAKLAESLVIDYTPEGMRIQIVDQDKYSMFPLGSAVMYDYTRRLLGEVAKIISKLPNHIAVTGHTDSTPYSRTSSYTNWELSTDRALASRRALLETGLLNEKIDRVIGKADKEHILPDEPNSPRNRRLSIVLLRETVPGTANPDSGAINRPSRASAAPVEPAL